MLTLLLSIAALALLAWSAWPLLVLLRRLEEAKAWKPVQAKVVDVRLAKKPWVKGKRLYRTVVYFFCRYEVGGRRFGLRRIGLYEGLNGHQRLVARRMTPKQEITVYVNPKRPHEGVVIPPSEHNLFWPVAKAVVVWTLVGFAVMLYVM